MTNTASTIRIVRLRDGVAGTSAPRPGICRACSAGTISFGGLLDEVGRVADRHAGHQVEVERDAGELVDVVHRLRAERRLPRRDGGQRDHALAVVALDVEQLEVLGLGRGRRP